MVKLGDLVAQLIVEQQEHGELIAIELEADELIIDPEAGQETLDLVQKHDIPAPPTRTEFATIFPRPRLHKGRYVWLTPIHIFTNEFTQQLLGVGEYPKSCRHLLLSGLSIVA
jgi:hypothetical protein